MHASEIIAPHTLRWAMRSKQRIERNLEERVRTARRKKLLLVHLDGVPRSVIERAIHAGKMPFLSRLVRSGAYHFDTAFWGSPASTPAFQAGALYGLRHPNLPAYNWFDRALGQQIRMNVPREALSVERRVTEMARGQSLLEDGGTAYLSLFRAGATNDLAMTSLADLRAMLPALCCQVRGIRQVRRAPVLEYVRRLARETWAAGMDAFRWIRRVGDRRHEGNFLLNRLLVTLAWGLAWNRTLIDMVRGVPAIYLVFGNFDEVAHRRGPFSARAASELYSADRAIEELYVMSRLVDEPYDIVLVTDHGHVDSAPFERRVGRKIDRYLFDPEPMELPADLARALRDGRALPDAAHVTSPRDPVVIEAGNFAHVYLERRKDPLEALEIVAKYPGALARAAASPEIGIVALRRGDSAVAIVRGRAYGPEEIENAPLAGEFSRRAVADLLRELPHMPTAGDLVLYGEATHAGGTIGFAWEFGSHGGLTRTETDSVVLWPRESPLDLRGLGHSAQLYEKLSEVYRN